LTLPAPYGGQYSAVTGWGRGAFGRNPKALPSGQYRVMARLEVRLHGQVEGLGSLRTPNNRCGPHAPSCSRSGPGPGSIDRSSPRRNNSSCNSLDRPDSSFPSSALLRIAPSIFTCTHSVLFATNTREHSFLVPPGSFSPCSLWM